MLSIVREEESDSIHPIPLPSSGLSVAGFFKFLENNKLSSEDAEEMARHVERKSYFKALFNMMQVVHFSFVEVIKYRDSNSTNMD